MAAIVYELGRFEATKANPSTADLFVDQVAKAA